MQSETDPFHWASQSYSCERRLQNRGNGTVTDIFELSSLNSAVRDFYIQVNDALTNILGLSNLTSVGGDFYTRDDNALINISGLSTLLLWEGSVISGLIMP